MQASELERLEHKLQALKNHLVRLVSGYREAGLNMPLTESIGELSSYDNHPADIGSETFEREKDWGIRNMAQRRLARVETALGKIAQGTYGVCERCGQWIEAERLEVAPEVEQCARCAGAGQPLQQEQRRPTEEAAMAGNIYDAQGNAYDGEDTWQDLARPSEHAPGAAAGSYYGDAARQKERPAVDNQGY